MLKTAIIFLYVSIIFSTWPAYAQSKDFNFRNITINDGLSQNSIVDITQDNQGFMWFATQDGLNRYDGNLFKIFPKSFDDITNPDNSKLGKLLIHGHTLWMITTGGKLETLDLATEIFSSKENFEKEAVKIPPVSFIHIENDDRIWIGTDNNGVYLVNSDLKMLVHYHQDAGGNQKILSDKINKIFQDSGGNIWVLTKAGINNISDKTTKEYLVGVNANTITEDPSGNLWLGTLGNGIYSKLKKQHTFTSFGAIPNGTPVPTDLVVEAIFMDENLRLWVGTYGDGLFIIEQASNRILQLLPDRKNANSIGFQDILSLYQDNKGSIWIGTDGGGLSFYDESYNNFKFLGNHNVPDNVAVEQIRAITTDQEGFLWFGTSGNGFSKYDPRTDQFWPFHLKPYKPGINNYDRIIALHADDTGDLWIGTHGNGTVILNRKTGKIKKWLTTDALEKDEKLPDNNLWCFLKEDDDKVWAGSRFSGLLLIDKNKGLISRHQTSEEDNIRTMVRVNDSTLALGYEKKGIKLFHTKTGVLEPLAKKFILENLDQVEIKSLFYSNGKLWAGTSGKGLLLIDLYSGDTRIFTEKDGLPNNMIYSVLMENSQKIWGSTNRGIFRLSFSPDRNDGLNMGQLELFTKESGLQSNEFNTGAYHSCAGGNLYFGGIMGINIFKPEDLVFNKNKIKTVISEAIVDNMPLKGDRIINYTDHLFLSSKQNSIAFSYSALDYISQEKLNYAYQLEGYDEDWISAGARKYTAYTNLDPGDYLFKVKLVNDLLEDAPVTTLGISIAAPFYNALWFKLLIGLIIMGIFYSLYRNRINQLMELQRVKDTISADLHDDLGSRLTTIHLLSAISQPRFKKNSETTSLLQKIDKEIYASSEALNEIVWNIKITDQSLTDMIANLRRHVSEVLEDCNIKYIIQTPDDMSPYKMRMQKRRELFLICKELINNVRKHAAAKMVIMHITCENNMLHVSVKDDGRGFDPDAASNRNGLKHTKKRVEKWKGRLRIASIINEGSLIELWIPFDNRGLFQRVYGRIFK